MKVLYSLESDINMRSGLKFKQDYFGFFSLKNRISIREQQQSRTVLLQISVIGRASKNMAESSMKMVLCISNKNGASNFKNMDSYVKTSKYHEEQG